jgi:alpha-L-fucosidase
LGWPEDGEFVIKTLAEGSQISTGGIKKISLLGSDEEIDWTQNAEGLVLQSPSKKPNEIAYAFRIDVDGALAE